MRIGFIGLGVMGAPMARHLVDAGQALETLSDHELSNGKE
nr:NAD(P)-binding domain-containing protein [Mesorhizobium carmichaelinearum]